MIVYPNLKKPALSFRNEDFELLASRCALELAQQEHYEQKQKVVR